MARTKASPGSKILTLKVVLDESDPPIWRRFQVLDDVTLGDLHYTLQIVMGWTNSHLHAFEIGGKEYGMKLDDEYDEMPMLDEEEFELRDLLEKKGKKFRYVYDFGDYWVHAVIVEDKSEPEANVLYPICIEGERSCPPEDCGRMQGYYEILEILKDPTHEEYESYLEWLPDGFSPEFFDVAETNAELNEIDVWRRMAEDEE